MLKLLFCCLLMVCAVSRADLSERTEDNIVVDTEEQELQQDFIRMSQLSMIYQCPPGDEVCEKDRIGFEAIHHLHRQIDDDQNGNLDRSESDEFIRDELQYQDGLDRHPNFHGTDDLISIDDLWKLWVQSEVYNWTVDDVADWVVNHVELPQYLEHVRVNAVDGHTLPRIAGNSQYVINILGIKNFVHRQKLSLKAMDLVLFGPPKRHNYVKDLALVAALLIACGGCWLAYLQNRHSQNHLRKVMKDLETLRKAEEAFSTLQVELEEAQENKKSVEEQKHNLEMTMKGQIDEAKTEADRLREQRESTEEEIQRLQLAEEELLQVRSALRRAEKELEEARLGVPLAELQSWLQLTYEIETKHYDSNRKSAERQLRIAKEMCEKMRKKRSAFLGSLRIAHTTSIDDTDRMIMNARVALEEVKMDLQERSQRWAAIENICGFAIKQNPGQVCLEAMLRAAGHANYTGVGTGLMTSRAMSSSSMMTPLGMDDADEDFPPGLLTSAAMQQMNSSLTHEKRSASLASAFGGSTNSVSMSSRPRAPLTTIPSIDDDSELVRTDSEENVSQMSSSVNVAATTQAAANGGVIFDLGGPADSNSGRQRANSTGKPVGSKGYRQSVSLDAGSSRTINRPHTLPSSLSEGSFKGLPVSTTPTKVNRQTPTTVAAPSTPTPSVDDNSSPESTDGSSITGEREKRKKKNVFRKILGRDKQKTS